MKNTILSIGAVMAALLLVVSAGCVSPPAGSSSSTGTPAVTAGENVSGTPALPDHVSSATPFLPTTAAGESGSRQVAATGDTVSVYYNGMFENGTVFESNMNATTPVEFTLGNSSVIEGFEDAVIGMSLNQQKTVYIPSDKAYGAYNTSLIHTVNRTGPIANTTFVEGQSYYIHDRETNAVSIVRILNVTPTTVTWDANDPLAGLNFTFTIKLVGITRP
jgi:peptidylprolyl isomerase